MGGKESKHFPITYDEAVKRVSESEKRRLQDAFRRSSAANSNISKQVRYFSQENMRISPWVYYSSLFYIGF